MSSLGLNNAIFDRLNFRAPFLLEGPPKLLEYYKFTCKESESLKTRHCLIDKVTARLKSGSCLIDKTATKVKSGGCHIDQAAAGLKSGSA